MAAHRTLKPLDPAAFDVAHASHLLARAGFGGDRAQAAALADMGLTEAVRCLVDYHAVAADTTEPDIDADVVRPPTAEERRMFRAARQSGDADALRKVQQMRSSQQRSDRQQHSNLRDWWLSRMIATGRPLEEKLTLLWHGHFASSYRSVRDSYLMYRQNQTFREHASGNFADLAHAVVRDPAMLKFLNNNRNLKTKPNENLAREFMELFTLGEGNYTENDIKQAARALTGYTFRDNDFVFVERMHDEGDKTVLGKTGALTGDDFVGILLEKPQCAKFIAFKLYRCFAADVETQNDAAIDALADEVRRNDFALAPTIETLLRSEHFYSDAVKGRKVKSPTQLTVQAVRSLHTPRRDLSTLNEAMALMGQELFSPPSVAGWDGGRGWINTSTLFIRHNTATYLLTGKLPTDRSWSPGNLNYDPAFLMKGLDSRRPDAVVDHLLPQVMAAPVDRGNRDVLVAFLRDRGDIKDHTILGLVMLMTTLPEYQLT